MRVLLQLQHPGTGLNQLATGLGGVPQNFDTGSLKCFFTLSFELRLQFGFCGQAQNFTHALGPLTRTQAGHIQPDFITTGQHHHIPRPGI